MSFQGNKMKIRVWLLLFLITAFTSSCSFITPPVVFPSFEEKQIVGPGTYEEDDLKWSFDGNYLAYVDQSGEWSTLGIYDLNQNKNWTLAETLEIAWHPNGQITYLIYVPNGTMMTYPIHNDLYIMDPDGKNERMILKGLSDITDFIWLNNEELLMVEYANGIQDVYKVNILDGARELFIRASELGAPQAAYSLALSPDKSKLLIWTDNPCKYGRGDCVALVVYDLETRQMMDRILGSQLSSLTIENGGVYGLNTAWVNSDWIATEGSAILNEAPYLSLAFVNTKDVLQSFEIEAENQFGGPVLSPDLTYIAYINVNRGPHTEFITLSEVPQDVLNRLIE